MKSHLTFYLMTLSTAMVLKPMASNEKRCDDFER
jgi:hypothetical protein